MSLTTLIQKPNYFIDSILRPNITLILLLNDTIRNVITYECFACVMTIMRPQIRTYTFIMFSVISYI